MNSGKLHLFQIHALASFAGIPAAAPSDKLEADHAAALADGMRRSRDYAVSCLASMALIVLRHRKGSSDGESGGYNGVAAWAKHF